MATTSPPSTQMPLSYRTAITKSQFPKREQVIVLEAKNDIELGEYTYAVGDIIGSQNVLATSKVSNNRIQVFLSSAKIANEITTNYKKIKVCGQDIEIRLLLTKHKRVVISNIPPSIPHSIVEDKMDEIQIRRESSLSFLRAGLTRPGYGHVLSFRRQIYINPDDEAKIPESLKITYEGTVYWLYLSTDTLKCFLRKQSGRIAKNCTQLTPTLHTIETDTNVHELDIPFSSQISQTTSLEKQTIPPSGNQENIKSQLQFDPERAIQIKRDIESRTKELLHKLNFTRETIHAPAMAQILIPPTTELESQLSDSTKMEIENSMQLKRTHSETSSILSDTSRLENNEKKLNSTKKTKQQEDNPFLELEPIFTNINNPINYIQFKSILENTQGQSNTLDIIREHTNSIPELLNLMKEKIYPELTSKTMKNRITRLTNKIKKELGITPSATPTNSDNEEPTI